jgi:hypothetical protein
VDRTCRTGEVVDLIYFHVERESHVVTYKLKSRIINKIFNIALGSRKEVIHTENLITPIKKSLYKMRTQKTCPP